MARLCLKNQKESYQLYGGTYSLLCPDVSKGSLNCGIMSQTGVCFYLTLHCYRLPSREELNHSLLEFMVNSDWSLYSYWISGLTESLLDFDSCKEPHAYSIGFSQA